MTLSLGSEALLDGAMWDDTQVLVRGMVEAFKCFSIDLAADAEQELSKHRRDLLMVVWAWVEALLRDNYRSANDMH